MRARWVISLGLALGISTRGVRAADEVIWHAAAARTTAAVREPVVTLGAPIAIVAPPQPAASGQITPVVWSASDPLPPLVVRAQADGLPPPAPPPVGQPPMPPPGIPNNPGPGDLYNNGVVPDTGPGGVPAGTGFWDKTKQLFDLQSGPFCGTGASRSRAITPSTASSRPLPTRSCLRTRSLTELRPIFMYQTIPTKNAGFHGGDIEFFGVQARVALTEKWSIVMNEFGGIWINPNSGAVEPYEGKRSGLTQMELGPKWTFLRNDQSGTLGALGLIFQFPIGDTRTFENTGTLSLVPYLTMGQNFGRSSYGSFNVLGELGYAFGVDSTRSDFFFTSLHLDYDIANMHKIYPLLELNWLYYTANGKGQTQDFEGGDLINFGATDITGHNNVILAAGLRYKFKECYQAGVAIEFPVDGTSRGIEDFRLTLDFIIRY